jgi:hypothetical protein
LNVCQIKRIDSHHAECVGDSSPKTISDTENWLNRNCDSDNPNDSEDDWKAYNESDTVLDKGSEDSEPLKQQSVSAAPNVPGLIKHL